MDSITPVVPKIQKVLAAESERPGSAASPPNYFYGHLDFFAECMLLHIDTRKPDYAINRHVLRAVLNGFQIDATVPCEIHRQGKRYSEELKRLQAEYVESRARLGERVMEGEEEWISDDDEETEAEEEAEDERRSMVAWLTSIPILNRMVR